MYHVLVHFKKPMFHYLKKNSLTILTNMAHQASHRSFPQRTRRASRAYSQTSSYATPRSALHSNATASPARPKPGSDHSNVQKIPTTDAPEPPRRPNFQLPAYWALTPTVPCPFSGTLEASLDAILEWGRQWGGGKAGAEVCNIVATLLGDVDPRTNWPVIIRGLFLNAGRESAAMQILYGGRQLAEELLFLATRTLLPEQIVENRGALARVYDEKRHLAIRLVLRYDMLREVKVRGSSKDARLHAVVVNSVAPQEELLVVGPSRAAQQQQSEPMSPNQSQRPSLDRRPLLPNIWPTLILPPPHLLAHGYLTHGYRERMRHHVTDLDPLLLYTDDEVHSWSEATLVARTATVLLMWQWMRKNNEVLADMEIGGWEDLDSKAEECVWVA